MQPKISVITATYNRSDVLQWAVRSVLRQTYPNWELIVVGDACTDDTAQLMAGFADPRIRFVNLPKNAGEQSVPNNHGLTLATGELIAYLNHDDLWFPDHLETLLTRLTAHELDLIYALPVSIDQNGLIFCGVTHSELHYDPSHMVQATLWLARRSMIETLGGWRLSRKIHARNPSQDLLYRAWKQNYRMRGSPRATALILASGARRGGYIARDDSQQRELFAAMSEPGFREDLMTRCAVIGAQLADQALQTVDSRVRRGRMMDRLLVKLGQHPDSVRNRLAGRKRGFWIEHLREVRGLSRRPGGGES